MSFPKRQIFLLPGLAICAGLVAATPLWASLDAARNFAQSMLEELGLEVTACDEKFLAEHTGEEHVCARSELSFRKFSAAWMNGAPRRAPHGVKQLGSWGSGDSGQYLQYEIQGTPLGVRFNQRGKQVTISYSDYSWNVWPCVEGRFDHAGDVFDASNDAEVAAPELVSKVQPRFPERARVARIQGSVELEALIDEEGTVQDICVKRPANRGVGFEQASIDAIRQWKYRPAMRRGVPVKVSFTVDTQFKLH